MSKKQTIPRQFLKLTGKLKVKTSLTEPGDELHVYKNKIGYLALNTRTGKYGYLFYSWLHNPDVFELISIER